MRSVAPASANHLTPEQAAALLRSASDATAALGCAK